MASMPNPINSRNVMHNTKSLNFSRTSLSVLSGVASGILGLTSVYGFLFYLITSGLLGFYYLLSDTRSQTKCFLNKQQLVTAFVMENLFTYILVWTLVYGCVHVYWGVHLQNFCYHTFAFELWIFHLNKWQICLSMIIWKNIFFTSIVLLYFLSIIK